MIYNHTHISKFTLAFWHKLYKAPWLAFSSSSPLPYMSKLSMGHGSLQMLFYHCWMTAKEITCNSFISWAVHTIYGSNIYTACRCLCTSIPSRSSWSPAISKCSSNLSLFSCRFCCHSLSFSAWISNDSIKSDVEKNGTTAISACSLCWCRRASQWQFQKKKTQTKKLGFTASKIIQARGYQ